MTPARPTNHSVTEEGVFRSRAFPDFVKRMDELDEVLKGRIALATLERMDESLVKPEELSPREFIKGILQFSRSSPSSRFNYQAINEAAIVLLSACLEGFIENLHAEVMGELLNERTRSQGVLKELVRYAHRRYSNPSPNRIRGLFKICGITGIVSDPPRRKSTTPSAPSRHWR